MKYDIVVAGVGGQGIITIAYIVDNASIGKGYHFKQAEVHGMAQRGGSVYSHLRVSSTEVISDLIPEGRADMLISLEPLEVQRYLSYLGPEGIVVSSNQPVRNIPDYPPIDKVYAALFQLKKCLLVDSAAIAMAAHVPPMAQNIVMLGVATPFLPFTCKEFTPFIAKYFEKKGKDVIETNIRALEMGYKIGLFYQDLLAHKMAASLVYLLVSKLAPDSVDPALAPQFAKATLANPKQMEEKLKQLEEPMVCSVEALRKLA